MTIVEVALFEPERHSDALWLWHDTQTSRSDLGACRSLTTSRRGYILHAARLSSRRRRINQVTVTQWIGRQCPVPF